MLLRANPSFPYGFIPNQNRVDLFGPKVYPNRSFGRIVLSVFVCFIILSLIVTSVGVLQAASVSNQDLGRLFGFTQPRLISYENRISQDFNTIAQEVSSSIVAIDMYRTDSEFKVGSNHSKGQSFQSFQIPKINRQLSGKNRVASGTGFFISSEGYLLTNAHVIFDPKASYVVLLSDGKEVDAEVVYRDIRQDLGILKVSGSNYPAIDLGNSSSVKIGNKVMGIGNAFGEYDNVMSQGMISGLNRTVIATGPLIEERLDGLIETDATMYPGDSGGPLFDSDGRVVGVNVAVSEDSSQSFAIPINVAKKVISKAKIDL